MMFSYKHPYNNNVSTNFIEFRKALKKDDFLHSEGHGWVTTGLVYNLKKWSSNKT